MSICAYWAKTRFCVQARFDCRARHRLFPYAGLAIAVQSATSALPSLFYVACLYMTDIYRDMSSRSRSTAISARFIQSFVLEVEGSDCAHTADSVSGSGHKKERVAVREWHARRKLRKKRRARRSALLCHHPSLITRGGNCWASIG